MNVPAKPGTPLSGGVSDVTCTAVGILANNGQSHAAGESSGIDVDDHANADQCEKDREDHSQP